MEILEILETRTSFVVPRGGERPALHSAEGGSHGRECHWVRTGSLPKRAERSGEAGLGTAKVLFIIDFLDFKGSS